MRLVLFAGWSGPRKTASIGQDISNRQFGLDRLSSSTVFVILSFPPWLQQRSRPMVDHAVVRVSDCAGADRCWAVDGFVVHFLSSSLFRSRLISFANPRLFSIVFLQLHRPQR